MKKFIIPTIEIVRISKADILTSSIIQGRSVLFSDEEIEDNDQ